MEKEIKYNPSKIIRVGSDRFVIKCEICQQKIPFTTLKKRRCITCEEFYELFADYLPVTVCSIITFLILLAAIGFLLFAAIQGIIKRNDIYLIILLFVLFLIVLLCFIKVTTSMTKQLFVTQLANVKFVKKIDI